MLDEFTRNPNGWTNLAPGRRPILMIRRMLRTGLPHGGEGWVVTLPGRFDCLEVIRASSLLEKQRCEVDQVVAPDHPGVTAGRFDDRDRNLLLLQPCGEGAVRRNQVIVCTAGDP